MRHLWSQVVKAVSVVVVFEFAEKDVPSSVFVPVIRDTLMKVWEAVKAEG